MKVIVLVVILLYSAAVQKVESRTFTLSGYVTDAASGETLIGAHIVERQGRTGTVTNEYGFFSLSLPEGVYEISVTYVGYQTLTVMIDVVSDVKRNFQLSAGAELDEVTVTGERSETGNSAVRMGAMDVPLEIIKSMPSLMGETDVMKTIRMLPGVQGGTEGTAGLYVRGGGPDENLIMLDGTPLYNIDHLLGMFSIFTPEAVKKVNLYKCSFPARFGGRLSSVIDVRTNDGDLYDYHGTLNIGLLASKLQLEGPIAKSRTSFNVSVRRSYFDVPMKLFIPPEERVTYYYYDINAKINHRFNERHRLYLSIYSGRDELESRYSDGGTRVVTNNTEMLWGNDLASLRWNWDVSPRLFANTTVSYTRYLFDIDNLWQEHEKGASVESEVYVKYSSGVRDASFNMDFDYHPLPHYRVSFGWKYIRHLFSPEVFVTRISDEDGDGTYDDSKTDVDADEYNLYVENIFSVARCLDFDLGVHASTFRVEGKTWKSVQPRLSARLQVSSNVAFKASFVEMKQYVHLLSNYMIALPTDLWTPATKNIKPMSALQYSVGAYYTFLQNWELSVEAYRKDLDNVLEYKDGASFFGTSDNWQNKVEMGIGRSSGIELMLQKRAGKTSGWLAYTLSESSRKFVHINEGRWFPYRYDRRHHLSFVMNCMFTERFDCGVSWEFFTGGAGTLAFQETALIAPDAYTVNDGNSPRVLNGRNPYPTTEYILSANFHKKKKYGAQTWNISVYNLYNAMNPALMYTVNNSLTNRKELKKITILPLLPSISYSYKF